MSAFRASINLQKICYDSQFPALLSTHFKAHRQGRLLEMTLPKMEKSVRHTVKIEAG